MGVPNNTLHIPLIGSQYLEEMGWTPTSSFWNGTARSLPERQRNELYLVASGTIWIGLLLHKLPQQNDYRLQFDIAYLFQQKGVLQTLRSIDLLCSANCYPDALTIVRSLHTRLNLLILCSCGPYLFDDWLKNPKHEIFIDGHIRTELANHGLYPFPHLYDTFSEIVHGQYQALNESGYMVNGLFPEIPAIANLVLVGAKFLIGVMGWVGLSMLLQDRGGEGRGTRLPHELQEAVLLYKYFRESLLVPNRYDHLWTMIPEERHWNKAGKGKKIVAQWFEFDEYRRQLGLFHRKSQPKQLGKKYRPAVAIK